jgi:hypothetical protein
VCILKLPTKVRRLLIVELYTIHDRNAADLV